MTTDYERQRLVPRAPAWRVLADALPLLAVIAAALWYWFSAPPPVVKPVHLDPVSVRSADALQAVFQRHDYQWVPQARVPALGLQAFPADLAQTDSRLKKTLFFRSLLPLVLAENRLIRIERAKLKSLFAQGDLAPKSEAWQTATRIAARYQVQGDINSEGVRDKLLHRVGEIPPSLALAQAANESAWGTSRFAREGNNLFGQWTWDKSQGMVPRRRASDASHFVRRFENLRASVRAYLRNLNTHSAYAELRQHRAELRRSGIPPTGMRLAGGLKAYSERGMAYVNEIREMIAYNRLQRINDARLALVEQ